MNDDLLNAPSAGDGKGQKIFGEEAGDRFSEVVGFGGVALDELAVHGLLSVVSGPWSVISCYLSLVTCHLED